MGVFGPSTREVWERLTDQLGGEVLTSWRGDKVQVAHGDWIMTLDTHVVMANNVPVFFTRMRAPFKNRSEFRFAISRRHILSDLAAWFGAQDVEIGDPDFDEAFVVKSNDEPRVRELLRDDALRAMLSAQPAISFAVKGDEGWFGATFPDDADELYYSVHGVIKDVDRLKALFELFAHTLDRLVQMGTADPVRPDVAL